ncbi:Aec26 [Salmonella enterica subsp. enterica serovar Sanjuan]|uniref:Aec26 n=1 Tax=Salmonella enterica subsp. enterica serovar Sanjuan TaxID=1160765 RepID=A0A3S4F4D5_SALET|nr:Aec26 [Salmonella enterica subsp. enterica serovar Sanjuan]
MSEQTVLLPDGSDEGATRRQYKLRLRGNSLNPMIDAATPLLGMVMRVTG